jgi:alpha-mannosidase
LELNQKAVFVIESAHPGEKPLEQSLCSIKGNTSAMITALKRSEDRDGWVVRVVEGAGKNTSAAIDFAWLGVSGTFSFSPYEIKTIKISDRDKSLSETNLLEM